jgi:hypothetical protein
MKVFISHKQEDEELAKQISNRLRNVHLIDTYLDVVDPKIASLSGPDLAEYVRKIMDGCGSLLAVVSAKTAASQWVPWEIGIATEKNFPLATFAGSAAYALPEFLQKWPYLTNQLELDFYAKRVKENETRSLARVLGKSYSAESLNESVRQSAKDFYRDLGRDLGR